MIICFPDVNECATNPCDANAACQNTRGSYQCTCNRGYYGNGKQCTASSKYLYYQIITKERNLSYDLVRIYTLLTNTTMLCFPHLTSIVFFSIVFILYRFQKNKFDFKRGKLSVEAFIKRVYRCLANHMVFGKHAIPCVFLQSWISSGKNIKWWPSKMQSEISFIRVLKLETFWK